MGNDSDDSTSSQSTKRSRGEMSAANNDFNWATFRTILAEQAASSERSLESKIDAQFQALALNLNSTLSNISMTCNERHSSSSAALASMSNKISTLQCQLDDEPDRLNRLADVIIRGIPILNNECGNLLAQLFGAIAKAVDYDISAHPPVKTMRLTSKTSSSVTSSPSPILVKFASVDHKSLFMPKYFAKKTLSLADVGIGTHKRIYCNDNLTIRNQSLLRQANVFKSKLLYSVFTRNGFVFYCIAKGDTPIKLVDMSQIHFLQSPANNINDPQVNEQREVIEHRDQLLSQPPPAVPASPAPSVDITSAGVSFQPPTEHQALSSSLSIAPYIIGASHMDTLPQPTPPKLITQLDTGQPPLFQPLLTPSSLDSSNVTLRRSTKTPNAQGRNPAIQSTSVIAHIPPSTN